MLDIYIFQLMQCMEKKSIEKNQDFFLFTIYLWLRSYSSPSFVDKMLNLCLSFHRLTPILAFSPPQKSSCWTKMCEIRKVEFWSFILIEDDRLGDCSCCFDAYSCPLGILMRSGLLMKGGTWWLLTPKVETYNYCKSRASKWHYFDLFR